MIYVLQGEGANAVTPSAFLPSAGCMETRCGCGCGFGFDTARRFDGDPEDIATVTCTATRNCADGGPVRAAQS